MFDAHGAWSWIFFDEILFDFPQLGKHFFLPIARFQLPVNFLVELPVLGHQLFPGGFIFCFKPLGFRAFPDLLGLLAHIFSADNHFLFYLLNNLRGLTLRNRCCLWFCCALSTSARSHCDSGGDGSGTARPTTWIVLRRSPAHLFGPRSQKLLDLLHHGRLFHASRLFCAPPWRSTVRHRVFL